MESPFFPRVFLSIFVIVISACASSEVTSKRGDVLGQPSIDPSKIIVEDYEQECFDRINQARRNADRLPLGRNPVLDGLARQHSVAMAEGGFVGHEQPNGSRVENRLRGANYEFEAYGENVYGPDATRAIDHRLLTPENTVKAWLKSPGHKKNILKKDYTETGVGYHGGYWTQIFTRPAVKIDEAPIYED